MNKIQLAQQFAHEAHDSIGQKRKYTGEPYWVHTDEVALIVSSVTNDEDMIAAAHLHDVLEDVTGINPVYNRVKIMATFGVDVVHLVDDLTDVYVREAFPSFNRSHRKRLERERIGKTSAPAKTIKLADLISNTKSIVQHDEGFAKTYLKEKFELLGFLADGDSTLLGQATAQCVEAMKKLGLTIPRISA
jgi:(p)ppGpp synthase/HD superfamily hydrolase